MSTKPSGLKPAPLKNEIAIEISGMNKWYGAFHVLRDIDLTIKRGERVVVCGPSGSGKSTLIRCINRLEEHQKGRIIVDGTELTNDVKKIDEIRREVGMVFQSFNLFPHLTVLDNLCLAQVWVRKTPRRQAEDELRSSNARYRLISELSSDYAFETCRTPDGRILTLWVLDSVQRILGYSAKEILALDDVRILYHPDDWPQAAEDIRQSFIGQVVRNEYRMFTKSGETRWVQIYRSPVKEADGLSLHGVLRLFVCVSEP